MKECRPTCGDAAVAERTGLCTCGDLSRPAPLCACVACVACCVFSPVTGIHMGGRLGGRLRRHSVQTRPLRWVRVGGICAIEAPVCSGRGRSQEGWRRRVRGGVGGASIGGGAARGEGGGGEEGGELAHRGGAASRGFVALLLQGLTAGGGVGDAALGGRDALQHVFASLLRTCMVRPRGCTTRLGRQSGAANMHAHGVRVSLMALCENVLMTRERNRAA